MMGLLLALSLTVNVVACVWILIAVGERDRARQELTDARSQNRLLRQELAVRVSYH